MKINEYQRKFINNFKTGAVYEIRVIRFVRKVVEFGCTKSRQNRMHENVPKTLDTRKSRHNSIGCIKKVSKYRRMCENIAKEGRMQEKAVNGASDVRKSRQNTVGCSLGRPAFLSLFSEKIPGLHTKLEWSSKYRRIRENFGKKLRIHEQLGKITSDAPKNRLNTV